MLIILKNILRLKFSMALHLLFLFSGHANGTVVFKKHTYGELADGQPYSYISKITNFDDNYVKFFTSKKNDGKENDIKLFVTLNVKTLNDKVLASIVFKNKSYDNRYIFIENLPYNDSDKKGYFNSLCEDMFAIFTDNNIKLDYLGSGGCQVGNMGIESWVEIAPQQEMSFTVMLNGSYFFLPGEHNYRIKTAGYLVVDKKWFITRNITENLFSIFDFNYQACKIGKHPYFFKKADELCETDPWEVNSLRHFMEYTFTRGGDDSFVGEEEPLCCKINSNQISIKINGSKIRSFHDFPRGQRSFSDY
ncbi:hypothetical protein B6O77_004596 [Salmonella enterica subsp. enterica serovar Mississippi]|nr:hypothetical protein [Salmonella enterica subsp. enterica serovar Mississippi]